MTNNYYVSFIVVAFICYIIVTDSSAEKFFVYTFDIIKNKIIIKLWWLKNNPRNPIVKYLMWRRSLKLAESIQKEFLNKK